MLTAQNKLHVHAHTCSHLRDLLNDEKRCMSLIKESEGIYFDFTRQRVTSKTMEVGLGVGGAQGGVRLGMQGGGGGASICVVRPCTVTKRHALTMRCLCHAP